jgi:hypothetical protein
MKKTQVISILSIIAVVLVGIIVGYNYLNNDANLQYVTISINPNIELAVNEDNKVVEAIPVNEDADILLADLNLVGMSIEEASTKIIDEAIEMGYIDELSDENAVMISTYGEEENRRTELQDRIIDRLNNHFETRKVYAVLVTRGLSEELKQEADNYGISYGKMLLVDRVSNLNTDLNKEELVNMSIREIQGEVKNVVSARHQDLKMTIDDAKDAWKQEKNEVKKEYQDRIDGFKSDLWEVEKTRGDNVSPDQKDQIIDSIIEDKKEEIKRNVEEIKREIKDTTARNVDAVKERIRDIKNR